MARSRPTPTLKELALIAAALSGAAQAHDDRRTARAFWRAATLLVIWPEGAIQQNGDGWSVPSENTPGVTYRVYRAGELLCCNCRSGRFGKPCKHTAVIETLLGAT
jgi:hypothetical protein